MHKFENFPKKGSQSVCYVSHLNRTNPATPQQVKDAMTDNEVIFNYSYFLFIFMTSGLGVK